MVTVEKIDHGNDDLTVVNAARVSFNRVSPCLTTQDERLIKFLADKGHWSPLAHPHYTFWFHKSWLPDLTAFFALRTAGFTVELDLNSDLKITGSLYAWARNEGLLPYDPAYFIRGCLTKAAPVAMKALGFAWEKEHIAEGVRWYEPDTHTFRITTPIFVARQLVKHQVGLVWNEVSRRYVKEDPEFHYPRVWRTGSKDIKQGSLDVPANWQPHLLYRIFCWFAKWFYKRMIRKGICAEQARMVLPQSMETSWWWTGTREAFDRIISLRCKPDAQRETKEIAEAIRANLQSERIIS